MSAAGVRPGCATWSRTSCARADGVPIGGICLYPLVDRHDWNDPSHWHDSGLWDVERPSMRRVLAADYADALAAAQAALPGPIVARFANADVVRRVTAATHFGIHRPAGFPASLTLPER